LREHLRNVLGKAMSLKRENISDLSDIEKKSKIGHCDLRKRKGRMP
jgi:hypothetical protein